MYTINYRFAKVTGDPYCLDCGGIAVKEIGKDSLLMWTNSNNVLSRIHMLICDKEFTCTRCSKHIDKYEHVTVISEEFL